LAITDDWISNEPYNMYQQWQKDLEHKIFMKQSYTALALVFLGFMVIMTMMIISLVTMPLFVFLYLVFAFTFPICLCWLIIRYFHTSIKQQKKDELELVSHVSFIDESIIFKCNNGQVYKVPYKSVRKVQPYGYHEGYLAKFSLESTTRANDRDKDSVPYGELYSDPTGTAFSIYLLDGYWQIKWEGIVVNNKIASLLQERIAAAKPPSTSTVYNQ
jgi:hypothetical protein